MSPDARTYRKCPKCGCEDYTRIITKKLYTHKSLGLPVYRSKLRTDKVFYSCEACSFSETWDKHKERREKEKKELDESVEAQMKEIMERKI